MKNYKNITSNRQQVNFADGSCTDIEPSKSKEIDETKVHESEMKRLGKFLVELPREDKTVKTNSKKASQTSSSKSPKSDQKSLGGND